MPINGRPLIEYWLRDLIAAGVGPIVINMHHLADLVDGWIRNSGFFHHIIPVFEEVLLGTGGTLLNSKDIVGDEPVMLIHGDNLSLCDPNDFLAAHRARPSGTEITMMTFYTKNPEACGIVTVDGKGVVHEFYEKADDSPGNLANAAVYIVEPCVMEFLSDLNQSIIDFSTEVLPFFLGKIYTYHNDGYHRDIGTFESLVQAQIEYPHVPQAPTIKDSWKTCYENRPEIFEQQMVQSLAETLNAGVIVADHGPFDLTSAQRSGEGEKVVVYVKDFMKLVDDNFFRQIQGMGSEGSMPFIYCPIAPQGIFSKEIFLKYGLRSFIGCSCVLH